MPENKKVSIDELKRTTDFYDGKKDISKLGAGDSYYIANLFKKNKNELFESVMKETHFIQMFNIGHQCAQAIPRLITAQSDHEEDTFAIYRMPGCNERNIKANDWTPTVKNICDTVSEELDQKFNHCVLTLFRDNKDKLCFHKDKLLDIQDNSLIVSVSLGETRPILFYSEDSKIRQTIMLRSGSALVIGPKTNKTFYHAIPCLVEEVNPRISLSLRAVESYAQFNKEDNRFKISGKGEEYQTTNYPFIVSHDDINDYSIETLKEIIKTKDEKKVILSDELERNIEPNL
jgi:alkylated DNA repair dioxygenase AlkB